MTVQNSSRSRFFKIENTKNNRRARRNRGIVYVLICREQEQQREILWDVDPDGLTIKTKEGSSKPYTFGKHELFSHLATLKGYAAFVSKIMHQQFHV